MNGVNQTTYVVNIFTFNLVDLEQLDLVLKCTNCRLGVVMERGQNEVEHQGSALMNLMVRLVVFQAFVPQFLQSVVMQEGEQ